MLSHNVAEGRDRMQHLESRVKVLTIFTPPKERRTGGDHECQMDKALIE